VCGPRCFGSTHVLDTRDELQVKYEMLRAHFVDQQPSRMSVRIGYSRQTLLLRDRMCGVASRVTRRTTGAVAPTKCTPESSRFCEPNGDDPASRRQRLWSGSHASRGAPPSSNGGATRAAAPAKKKLRAPYNEPRHRDRPVWIREVSARPVRHASAVRAPPSGLSCLGHSRG